MTALGGEIQAKLWPTTDQERDKAINAGHDLNRILGTRDLVTGDNNFFCATGITDGELLQGVRYSPQGPTTNSIVMRSKSKTIREIKSEHHYAPNSQYSTVAFLTDF